MDTALATEIAVSPTAVYEGDGYTTITISGLPPSEQVRVEAVTVGLADNKGKSAGAYVDNGEFLGLNNYTEMRPKIFGTNTTSIEGTLSFDILVENLEWISSRTSAPQMTISFEHMNFTKIGSVLVDLVPKAVIDVSHLAPYSPTEGDTIVFSIYKTTSYYTYSKQVDVRINLIQTVPSGYDNVKPKVTITPMTVSIPVDEWGTTVTFETADNDIAGPDGTLEIEILDGTHHVAGFTYPYTLINDDVAGVLLSKDCNDVYDEHLTLDLVEGADELASYCLKLTSEPVQLVQIKAYELPREFSRSEQYGDIIKSEREYGPTRVGCDISKSNHHGREIATVSNTKMHVCMDRIIAEFDSNNWDTWQRAGQYAALHDIDGFDHTFTVKSSIIQPIVSKVCYAGCVGLPPVTFNIDDDDDLPQNVIFDRDVGSMTLDEETFTFGMKLKSDPGNITHSVYVRTDANNIVKVSGGSFAASGIRSTTFDTNNWNNYQYFTLTPVNGSTTYDSTAEILIRSDDPSKPGLLRDPHPVLPNSLKRDSQHDGYNHYDYHYPFYITVPGELGPRPLSESMNNVMNSPPSLNSPIEINPYWPIPEWSFYQSESLVLLDKPDNPLFLSTTDGAVSMAKNGSMLINASLATPLLEGERAKVTVKIQGCGKNLKHCQLSLLADDVNNVKLKGEGKKKQHLVFHEGAQNATLQLTGTSETDRTVKIILGKIKNTGGATVISSSAIRVDLVTPEPPLAVDVDSLQAVHIGADSLTVAWPPVSGATTYEVIITSHQTGTIYYTTTDTHHTISGLSANTDYSVMVLDDLYTMAGQSVEITTLP